MEKSKKVFHPFHRTAWSLRTQDMPLKAVSPSEGVVDLGGTRKYPCRLSIPEDTLCILWGYWSNSDRKHVTVLKPEDGLPDVRVIHPDPEEIKTLPTEAARKWATEFLLD
jgi:hypothetical protein